MTDNSPLLDYLRRRAECCPVFCSLLYPGNLVQSLNKYVGRVKCNTPFCGEWGRLLTGSGRLSWRVKDEQLSVQE